MSLRCELKNFRLFFFLQHFDYLEALVIFVFRHNFRIQHFDYLTVFVTFPFWWNLRVQVDMQYLSFYYSSTKKAFSFLIQRELPKPLIPKHFKTSFIQVHKGKPQLFSDTCHYFLPYSHEHYDNLCLKISDLTPISQMYLRCVALSGWTKSVRSKWLGNIIDWGS